MPTAYTPKEILDVMNWASRLDFMRPALPREGLLQIGGIIKILKSNLRAKTFEDLKIPLMLLQQILITAKQYIFRKEIFLNL